MFLYYSDSQLTKKTHNMPPSICRRGDIWGYFCVHFGICSYFVRNIQSFHIKLCKSCWHYSDDHYTKKIECMSYSARGNTGGYFRTILGYYIPVTWEPINLSLPNFPNNMTVTTLKTIQYFLKNFCTDSQTWYYPYTHEKKKNYGIWLLLGYVSAHFGYISSCMGKLNISSWYFAQNFLLWLS